MKQVLGVDVQPTTVKEPVMNVPAIDMTDPVAGANKPSAPARRKRAKRSASRRTQPSRSALAKVQQKRTRGGSVGRETFEQVEALVKQGKSKAEAFKQIAQDTGKNVGTVGASYYRVVRASGGVTPPKARAKASPSTRASNRQSATRKGRRHSSVNTGNGGEGVDRIVAQLVASVAALTEGVKAQDAEVRELRGRLEEVRGRTK